MREKGDLGHERRVPGPILDLLDDLLPLEISKRKRPPRGYPVGVRSFALSAARIRMRTEGETSAYVPMSQLLRYLVCSSVNWSMAMPIVWSLRLATHWSTSLGTW